MKPPVITVVNRHHGNPLAPSVYVGRPHVLGNPYYLGKDGPREVVVPQYEIWLRGELAKGRGKSKAGKAMNGLYLLAKHHGRLQLVCSCAPLLCHADIIKKILDEVFTSRSTK